MKVFITSQFNYSPLVWMFHSKIQGQKINALHERASRIPYGNKTSLFNELQEKGNFVSIHHKNLQALKTEICKVSDNISPIILNETFGLRDTPYNLRNPDSFKMRKVLSFYNGTEALFHLGPKVWSLVPHEIQQSVSFGDFKSTIKTWTPSNYPCRLSKKYLHQVGFF